MSSVLSETQLDVHRSTISNNSSSTNGGGIAIINAVLIEVIDTSIFANSAGGFGGAIYHNAIDQPLTITQSTISANSSGSSGGGIYSEGIGSGSGRDIVTIRHGLVAENTSVFTGGGIYVFGKQIILNHAVVARNIDNSGSAPDVGGDSGGIGSMRYSLLGDGKSGTSSYPEAPVGMPDANGNMIGGPVNGTINPLLGSLADNGGPTKTHPLLAGSPAIDAGDPAFVPPPTNDQRGAPYVRVVDGDGTGGARIDMGPFEYVPSAGPELPGDYNDNDKVDAADYVLWRKYRNTATELPSDATAGVDDSDYGVWRSNFGNSLPAASGGTGLLPSANPAVAVAQQQTDYPFSTAAIDLLMADLATDRAARGDRFRFFSESAERANTFAT
jgi:predicted outer membrane repeat protein